MIDSSYARACTEVLEIISHFPEDEYLKIPKDRIEFFEQYKDAGYEYSINPEIDLAEQYISKEAKAMIIEIYREYFATDHQRSVIDDILNNNQLLMDKKNEINYYDKYSNNDKLVNQIEDRKDSSEKNEFDNSEEEDKVITEIMEYKESFLVKLKRFIFKIFHIEEK